MGGASSTPVGDRVTLEQATEHLPGLFRALAASDPRGSVDGTISVATFLSLFRKAQCTNLSNLWDTKADRMRAKDLTNVLAETSRTARKQ